MFGLDEGSRRTLHDQDNSSTQDQKLLMSSFDRVERAHSIEQMPAQKVVHILFCCEKLVGFWGFVLGSPNMLWINEIIKGGLRASLGLLERQVQERQLEFTPSGRVPPLCIYMFV